MAFELEEKVPGDAGENVQRAAVGGALQGLDSRPQPCVITREPAGPRSGAGGKQEGLFVGSLPEYFGAEIAEQGMQFLGWPAARGGRGQQGVGPDRYLPQQLAVLIGQADGLGRGRVAGRPHGWVADSHRAAPCRAYKTELYYNN